MSHLTFTNALPAWAVFLVIAAIAAIAWRAYAHSLVPRPRRDVLMACASSRSPPSLCS